MKKLLFILTIFFMTNAFAIQESGISVSWQHVGNVVDGKSLVKCRFILVNNETNPLKTSGWKFFFNYLRVDNADVLKGNISIKRVNGDLSVIEPTKDFKELMPKDTCIIEFVANYWIVNITDAPKGGYFVFYSQDGKATEVKTVKEITNISLPERNINRSTKDIFPIEKSKKRYEENKNLSVLPDTSVSKPFPTPYYSKLSKGKFTFNSNTVFQFDNRQNLSNEIVDLQRFLDKWGLSLKVKNEAKENVIVLRIDNNLKVNNSNKEAYSLTVTKSKIEIIGSDQAGLFYGIQSLKTMFPHDNKIRIDINCMEVKDAPRFEYRGLFLDVARNFHGKEFVLKTLDIMALYKLNKFHFHICDDEGWRIEINGLPELTETGSRRGFSEKEDDCMTPSFGSGADFNSKKSRGNGFYTRKEMIEILKYAASKHIEVILELDMPGHARAAVKSMNARYNKYIVKGDTAEAEKYLLSDFNDKSVYSSAQNWHDNVVCVVKPTVYYFLDKIVGELKGMYSEADLKLKNLHIGGDEVPAGAWSKSDICNEFLAKNPEYKTSKDLFKYFVSEFNQILKKNKINTCGWEEIAADHQENGAMTPNAKALKNNYIPYVWNNMWGAKNFDIGYQLANAGFKVVLAPVTNYYFDLAYNKDKDETGLYWGGFADTKKAFECTPEDFIKCAGIDENGNLIDKKALRENSKSLSKEGLSNILGIQGLFWSECSSSDEYTEYMIMPKMFGLAERAWSPQPEWSKTKGDTINSAKFSKDWNIFTNRLGQRELNRIDFLFDQINYRIPLPGAIVENGKIKANIEFPGLAIKYTTDGSEPQYHSQSYTQPIDAKGTVKLRAFNKAGRGSRTVVVEN